MRIKEIIEEDLTNAMKKRDEFVLSVLRMLKSAIKNAEIAKKEELSDSEVEKVLAIQAKQRKDSIFQFKDAGREDLAEKEEKELVVIETYLPEKMSEEDIRKVISEKVNKGDTNFGSVMGSTMKELGQNADGSLVRKIVEEELNK